MESKRIWIGIGVVSILLIGALAIERQDPAKIQTITLEEGRLLVRGENLHHVRIVGIPAASEDTTPVEIGQATKEKTWNDTETWTYTPEKVSFLYKEVYAEGFDASGENVGRVELPLFGSNELFNAFFGEGRVVAENL